MEAMNNSSAVNRVSKRLFPEDSGTQKKKSRSMTDRARDFFEPEPVLKSSENDVEAAEGTKTNDNISASEVTPQKKRQCFGLKCKLCADRRVISISNYHYSNLTSHLKHIHKDVYNNYITDKNDYEVDIHLAAKKRLNLLQSCTELIAFKGAAFALIGSQEYLRGVQDTLDYLERAKCPLDLECRNQLVLKTYISELKRKIQHEIAEEIGRSPIALMIDLATRHGRSIIGISIQYLKGFHIKTTTIGLKETTLANTTHNLKMVITDCLLEYGLEMYQIISITSDNGANLTAMARHFSTLQDTEEEEEDDPEDGGTLEVESEVNSLNGRNSELENGHGGRDDSAINSHIEFDISEVI